MKSVGLSSTNCIAALLCLFLSQASLIAAEENSCRIKIGLLLPMTGPASLIGERSEQAAKLALEQLPAEIRNRIELVFEDTEMKPASGFRAVQKLVADSEVMGLTGFGSETAGASADFIERKQVPAIFVTPDRKPIKEKNYLFRHWVDGKDMREILTPEIKKLGVKKVAIVYSELPAMSGFADEFESNSKESGFEVTYKTNVLPAEIDFRTVVSALLKTRPQAVFFFFLPPQISIFMKQLRAVDKSIPVFTYINTENSKEIKAGEGALNGVTYAGPQFSPSFIEPFQNRFNEYPEFASGNIFDIVNIYAKILAQGACSRKEFKAGISGLNRFEGALGTYGVEDKNDFRFPVKLKRITNGKFEFLQ